MAFESWSATMRASPRRRGNAFARTAAARLLMGSLARMTPSSPGSGSASLVARTGMVMRRMACQLADPRLPMNGGFVLSVGARIGSRKVVAARRRRLQRVGTAINVGEDGGARASGIWTPEAAACHDPTSCPLEVVSVAGTVAVLMTVRTVGGDSSAVLMAMGKAQACGIARHACMSGMTSRRKGRAPGLLERRTLVRFHWMRRDGSVRMRDFSSLCRGCQAFRSFRCSTLLATRCLHRSPKDFRGASLRSRDSSL